MVVESYYVFEYVVEEQYYYNLEARLVDYFFEVLQEVYLVQGVYFEVFLEEKIEYYICDIKYG